MENKKPPAWMLRFHYEPTANAFEESENSIRHRIWRMTGFEYDRIGNTEPCGVCEYTAEPGIGTIQVCRQAKFTFHGRQYLIEFPTNSLTVLVDPPLESIEGEEV